MELTLCGIRAGDIGTCSQAHLASSSFGCKCSTGAGDHKYLPSAAGSWSILLPFWCVNFDWMEPYESLIMPPIESELYKEFMEDFKPWRASHLLTWTWFGLYAVKEEEDTTHVLLPVCGVVRRLVTVAPSDSLGLAWRFMLLPEFLAIN